MSAHTKKLRTETDEEHAIIMCLIGNEWTERLRYQGDGDLDISALRVMLEDWGFTREESVPWREAFPDMGHTGDPGVFLAGGRHKEGFSQRKLAELTGIPQRHISEMENGQRPIGKKTAHKLAKALNVGYKVFM